MDRDQFFSGIFNENSEQAISARAQRQLAFEERVIKRVFRECCIRISSWGKLANDCREVTGQPNLNFQWFNSSFMFPEMLYGKRIYSGKRGPKLETLTLRDLLQPVDKNKAYKCIARALELHELDEGSFFVFVFPVVQKMFCAHNLTPLVEARNPATRLTFVGENNDSLMYVEPTQTVFSAVGTSWWGQ